MATMPNTNINIPYSAFLDPTTGRPTQAWLLWLMSPSFISVNLGSALPVTSGGTGLTTIPTNGQLLIGNGTGYTLNTLGYGAGISVTNGSGTITVANTGVLSNLAGAGISVSNPTGNVTIGNTGVLSIIAGSGISASSPTGNVTVANTGVLSFSGGTTGLTPATATTGAVTLAGTLAIANGGTNGTATPTAYGVAYGTGTAYAFTAAGTAKQVLIANTSAAPTWSTLTTGTSILYGDGTGGFSNVTIGSGVSFVTGTLSATGSGGTVTSVTGTSPVVSSGGNTPAISLAAAYGDTLNPYGTKTATYVLAGPTTGAATAPTFRALVSTDIPSLSYVSSVSATAPITSTGGLTPTIAVTSSALTKTDDTNVTVTLGGSPTTALLAATSLTLGWSGQLAVSRGGTGLSAGTSGGIPYFSSTSTIASSALLTQYGVVYGGGAGASPVATAAGTTGQVLTATTGGAPTWANPSTSGTVTSVSVVSANGFAGSVATATTTPAITISTSITGLLKGNGTAISAATAGTDYAPATSGSSILYGNGSGGFSNVTVGSGLSFSAGTLASTASTVSAPITKTADFTVGAGETWFINNKSGSTCTVTLPSASTNTGRELTFKNMQAQTLISASSNVVPIDSTTAGTAILLGVVGNWATCVSDGTNWVIMQAASNNNLLLE
ncbi:MAG: hypothetical protein WCP79_11715 [Bacillota bacterium]